MSKKSENGFEADYVYDSGSQRSQMVIKHNGNAILTRWYPSGNYIKEVAGEVTKEYTFIGGDAYTAPAVAITQNDVTKYYSIIRDHLGSITHVVDSTGTVIAEYSYDAWGRMRDPATWVDYTPGTEPQLIIAGRGYTGHEHMPWFNTINMNGRVYDPLIGMFLSPDNYIQSPGSSQNFNRYSYCLNNPLKYKDPSGYEISIPNWWTFWYIVSNLCKKGGSWNSNSGFNNYDTQEQAIQQNVNGPQINEGENSSRGGPGLTVEEFPEVTDEQGGVLTTTYYSNGINEAVKVVARNQTLGYYRVDWTYFPGTPPSGQGGDWIRRAEDFSGIIADGAGLSGIVYSAKNAFHEDTWLAKNGVFYNSSKIRMNGGYARSAQMAKSAMKPLAVTAKFFSYVNVAFVGTEFLMSDKSAGDWAKLGVNGAALIVGAAVPIAGPAIAFGITFADAMGWFNGFYEWADQ